MTSPPYNPRPLAAARPDAVELDQVALHVPLEDGPRDAALGEPRERALEGLAARREYHVALLSVVDVGPLHPDRERAPVAFPGRGDQPARDERDVGLGELGDHLLAVGVEHGDGTVDLAHAGRLPGTQLAQDRRTLAHQEDGPRPRGPRGAQPVGVLELHPESPRLELRRGQAQDLRVVALAARRVRLFPEDAPAGRTVHSIPPGRIVGIARARASASARATSSARSTSTTVSITSAYTGSPARSSQARNSRSRPSPGSGR